MSTKVYAKIIRTTVEKQVIVHECNSQEEAEALIAKNGINCNWDCMPSTKESFTEVVYENKIEIEGKKSILKLDKPTKDIKEIYEGDSVVLFNIKELLLADFEVNSSGEMIFENLDLDLSEITNQNIAAEVVWVDSDFDFKFVRNGYTLPNEIIKEIFRKDS